MYSVTVVVMWIVVVESCSTADGIGTKAPGEFDSNGGTSTPGTPFGEGSGLHGTVAVASWTASSGVRMGGTDKITGKVFAGSCTSFIGASSGIALGDGNCSEQTSKVEPVL